MKKKRKLNDMTLPGANTRDPTPKKAIGEKT